MHVLASFLLELINGVMYTYTAAYRSVYITTYTVEKSMNNQLSTLDKTWHFLNFMSGKYDWHMTCHMQEFSAERHTADLNFSHMEIWMYYPTLHKSCMWHVMLVIFLRRKIQEIPHFFPSAKSLGYLNRPLIELSHKSYKARLKFQHSNW